MQITLIPSRIFTIIIITILLIIIGVSVILYDVLIALVSICLSSIYVLYILKQQRCDVLNYYGDRILLGDVVITQLSYTLIGGLYIIMRYVQVTDPRQTMRTKVIFLDSIRGASVAELLRSQYV